MSSWSYISLGKQTFGCLRDAFCALFCLAYFMILRKSRGSLSHILPGPRLCRDQAWSYGVRQINNNSSISAAELGELNDFSDTPQETKDTSRNKTCDFSSWTLHPWPHHLVSVYSTTLHTCSSSKYLILGRFRVEEFLSPHQWKVLDSQCFRPKSAIYQYVAAVWIACVLLLGGSGDHTAVPAEHIFTKSQTGALRAGDPWRCVSWRCPKSRNKLKVLEKYLSKVANKTACPGWVDRSASWKNHGLMSL